MRMLSFARRTTKEILRDPLNLAFGLGFPVALILLMSAIQANVPVPIFEIQRLAPGISVFGLSFMTLFSATLVARDRETAFLERLYTTPMKATDFIFGYILPMIPIAMAQTIVCYLLAVVLGLPVSISILYAVLLNLPAALFFIALGLLCGSLFTVKQVGGICGALLTNLSAWLSGAWFDLTLVGGAFEKIAPPSRSCTLSKSSAPSSQAPPPPSPPTSSGSPPTPPSPSPPRSAFSCGR